MTPAERIVVEAATHLVRNTSDAHVERLARLTRAVGALESERAAAPADEVEITWGQVLDGEAFLNTRNGKWYIAQHIARIKGAPVRVTVADENGKALTRPAATGRGTEHVIVTYETATEVRVRRSPEGKAFDAFATVLWSA